MGRYTEDAMDARQFEEELARQNEQLEATMKALSAMGDVQFAMPEELLRSIDEACAPRARVPTTRNVFCPGVRV